MAIYQKGQMYGKMSLRDGARGFAADGEHINRTQHTLNTSMHEATNIKYGMDDRLQREFIYGYGAGFNQMLIAKGRIVAVDPYLLTFDADTQKEDNTLTLANGGVDVEYNADVKQWVATETAFAIDSETNKDETRAETCRPANKPIGILIRNEYTRDYNALNGISPGTVNTDCMTELPLFAAEEKAKANPWGSAYGALKPGDLVKSDTTGRFVLSGLSDDTWLATAEAKDIELERQQVVGEVYEVRKELVPMGAAKYAQWALSDILEFEEFNPDTRRKTNRRGEDNIESTPYKAEGKAPFGYDATQLGEHDLHMLGLDDKGVSRQAYNKRMQHKYRFDFGIPGLTDGYNAVAKVIAPQAVGTIKKDALDVVHTFRTQDTNVVVDSITLNPTVDATTGALTGGTVLKADKTTTGDALPAGLELVYVNELQGIVQFKVTEELQSDLDVKLAYTKKGEAGVPTQLDWDGCVGTVKILLQK